MDKFELFIAGDFSKMLLSEYLLRAVLKLLYKEVPENGRHLHQYFSFFWMYGGLGISEVISYSVTFLI